MLKRPIYVRQARWIDRRRLDMTGEKLSVFAVPNATIHPTGQGMRKGRLRFGCVLTNGGPGSGGHFCCSLTSVR